MGADSREGSRPGGLWFDALIAVVVTAAQLGSIAVVGRDDGGSVPVAAYLVMAVTGLPLILRTRWPVIVWSIVMSATVVYGLATWPDPPVYLGGLIALYTVASLTRRPVAIATGVITLTAAVLSWVFDPAPSDLNDLLTPLLAASTAWLAGIVAGTQRETIALLHERAERIDRERHDHEERIVAEERLRIARDLHDITAHHVSLVAVQAEAGVSDPDTALAALGAISASARMALSDLRRMLSVMRGNQVRDPRDPQPGLDDLPELIERVRAGGLDVHLERRGVEPGQDGLELAAFRIVQEALTNIVRHSGATEVVVTIETTPDSLSLEVVDDGRGLGAGLVEGNGLRGIRERVALYNGDLGIEARDPSGVRLCARLMR